MIFEEQHYQNLRYRVDLLPEGKNPLEVFKEFAFYPEFKDVDLGKNLDFTKIFKYIGFLYQPNTPLSAAYENVIKRKVEAAKLSWFDLQKSGVFTDAYQDVIDCKNESVNKMIIRFCRIFRNLDHTELMIYEDEYYNELLNLKKLDKPKERKDTMMNLETMKLKINSLIDVITFGDNNKKLIITLLDELETEQLELKPEDIAAKLQRREDPLAGFSIADFMRKRNKQLTEK